MASDSYDGWSPGGHRGSAAILAEGERSSSGAAEPPTRPGHPPTRVAEAGASRAVLPRSA